MQNSFNLRMSNSLFAIWWFPNAIHVLLCKTVTARRESEQRATMWLINFNYVSNKTIDYIDSVAATRLNNAHLSKLMWGTSHLITITLTIIRCTFNWLIECIDRRQTAQHKRANNERTKINNRNYPLKCKQWRTGRPSIWHQMYGLNADTSRFT